jgi:putative N6-adenine-specific DNA methylase
VAPPKPAEPKTTPTPVAAPIRPGPSPTGVYELIATTAFGLEAIVDRELKALGYTETRIEDGRVRFWGNFQAVCRANLWLRSADRVQIVLGEFEADDFDPLFFQTREIPWEEWLPMDAQFPVNGRSFQSRLHGVPVCQKMIKKAIVERLKTKYQRAWFQETGSLYEIDFIILRDRVTLTLDASGDGLHKRGYRPEVGIAPLRETLAAALIQLSYWNRDRLLVDPCCGTGTIPIEAAMIARNIAPGFNREFSSEGWPQIPSKFWAEARKEARDLRGKPLSTRIWGSDIDPRAIELARKNAKDAGVAEDIMFSVKPAGQLALTQEYACLVTNPPYGERMGDRDLVDALNRDLGAIARSHPTWSTYVLTPHPLLERQFGRPADRRRKLFNGKIECTYYQYYGPRPPLANGEVDTTEPDSDAVVPPPAVAPPAVVVPAAVVPEVAPVPPVVAIEMGEAPRGVPSEAPPTALEHVTTLPDEIGQSTAPEEIPNEPDRPRSLWDLAEGERGREGSDAPPPETASGEEP